MGNANRISVLVLVAVSIIWIPVINSMASSRLFDYMQLVQNLIAPPVTAVFLMAVLWPRTNEQGAFWGFMVGLLLGAIRFILEFTYTIPPCGSDIADTRSDFIKVFVGNVHYLHYGCILFVCTLLTTFVVSIMTQPIDEDYLHRLTFSSRHSTRVRLEFSNEIETTDNKRESTETEANEGEVQTSLPTWRKGLNFICGLQTEQLNKTSQGSQAVVRPSPEVEALNAAHSIEEDPFWAKVVNLNAAVALTISACLWGWYA